MSVVSPHGPGFEGPVLMSQDWVNLSFLHWAVEPKSVAHYFPAHCWPDTFQGKTYVGLIPFLMRNAAVGRRPRVPWFGSFLETNVRLYSTDDQGRKGVVFLSLDCDRAAVVGGARLGFGVPYRWARMRYQSASTYGGATLHQYSATLRTPSRWGNQPRSRIEVLVGQEREPSDLDIFLSARWGLHSRAYRQELYVPNRHRPWPLHDATVTHLEDELMASVGLPGLSQRPPDHVAFSPGVHTEFGLPVRSGRTR